MKITVYQMQSGWYFEPEGWDWERRGHFSGPYETEADVRSGARFEFGEGVEFA